MPSFFTALKRILQGKPVFDAKDNPVEATPNLPIPEVPPPDAAPPPVSAVRKGDPSTFPMVYVRRILIHQNGPNMRIDGFIHNYSPGQVLLDKIRFLGKVRELDTFLRPGEEREFMLYNGPKLQKPHDSEAFLQYRTKEGDYFEAMHDVKFAYQQSDRTYLVQSMHLHLPIRDIFG